MKKGFRILSYVLLPLFAAIFIVGDVIAYKNNGLITAVLSGNQANFEGEDVEKATQLGDALCRDIEEEGIVLLKNTELSNGEMSLPLSEDVTKVNVFGWGATQFFQKGVGSGSSSINPDRSINFLEALEQYGISYNKTITREYTKFSTEDLLVKNKSDDYRLFQPSVNWHRSLIDEAKAYSETALLVLHRVGGENIGEIPLTQTLVTESGKETVSSRTYLETTKHEDDLIELLGQNFKNVVLILNTTNPMHLGCLKGSAIKSCISVGITGQSGAAAIPNILWGKKIVDNNTVLVSPSGRLTDIYSYSPSTAPSYFNSKPTTGDSKHIQYLEDIYYGYKWYETADEEGFWDSYNNEYGTGYKAVVQFPFGFGESYSEFEWKDMEVNVSSGTEINKDTTVNVSVTVKNIGNYPAKDVVQLYVSPSYKEGEIEKPSIQLVDFGKTKVLNPNQEEKIRLSFDLYDIASYDCYDKNNNGFKGYEVDYGKDGNYVIKLMSDSHNLKEVSGGNTYTLNIPLEGIKFENDNRTDYPVTNRMSGDNAYAEVPIDGSTVGAETNYLSRANFVMPNAQAKTPTSEGKAGQGPNYYCDHYATTTMPNTRPVDSGLRIATLEDGSFATLEQLSGKADANIVANEDLIRQLHDYDADIWDTLLDQLSISDICDLVENGGFHTYPIDSIGKPRAFDTDGPAGFNLNTLSIGDGDPTMWTAYPSETVIGQTWNKELAEKMGLVMGMEAQATKVQGWYAPGVNLHRSPYTARNYEYYSEDPVLSGVLAAKVIKGAKTNGLYCYLKHFVLSEEGPNPRKVNTWVTEQNLRENYLKPFEIAVKKGEANAIMSAFNRVGSVWAGANFACLTQILRDEWGFRGSVITDYAMTNDVGNMNPNQGVRAGNDLWLNPNDGTISNPLDRNNPTVVNAARQAAKNIIYTFIDTYYFGISHTSLYPGYDADVSMNVASTGDAWWIPLLITIEAVIAGGLITFFAFALAGDIRILMKKPKKEKIKREPRPFYITKRLRRVMAITMAVGLTGAILLVTLVPLFSEILINRNASSSVIPVDIGEVYENRFEFEDGKIEGNSVNEDHLCIAKSYFYNMSLSNNGAITNLNESTKISFKFESNKNYKVSLNIRMASVYDESSSRWVEAKLDDYLSLTINQSKVDLSNFMIPASIQTKKLDNYEGNDMNMVDVIGIPVVVSNIPNNYEFTIKNNCPALDSFSIYTSAEISGYSATNNFTDTLSCINLVEVPSSIKEGNVSIGCSFEGCSEVSTFNIPILTTKKWYEYNADINSYSFYVYDKNYVITPDTAGSYIGTVHSECKEVKSFTGDNFFKGSNWNFQSSTKQTPEDYVYTVADIIDENGNVVLTDTTFAKTRIFYCDTNSRKPLTDYANAQNKDYLGKKIEYNFLVNASGGFTLTAFGLTYSDAKLKAKNSVPGIFFNFKEDGNVTLTIGVDNGGKTERNVFKTPLDFISADSYFNFNQDNWIKFEFTRYTPEIFELALYVNDTKVNFPIMPTSTTGDIAYRYTENGNIYIIQSSTVSHPWGEFIAVAPNEGKVFTFKDLNYKVGN